MPGPVYKFAAVGGFGKKQAHKTIHRKAARLRAKAAKTKGGK